MSTSPPSLRASVDSWRARQGQELEAGKTYIVAEADSEGKTTYFFEPEPGQTKKPKPRTSNGSTPPPGGILAKD